jgi:3-deoxy-D-manno-octulosonate 8-phosphate phosphatase KdsC-like HAD superfamily phosphatase
MDVINSIKENNKRVFVTQHYGGNGAVREIIDYFENIKIKGL